MLMRARILVTLVVVGALFVAGAPVASADSSAACTGMSASGTGCTSATVTVVVVVDGQETTITLSEGGAAVICHTTRGTAGAPIVVPCSSDAGWWSGEHNCYVRATAPQPPLSDPLWQGNTTGKIYDCTLPLGIYGPIVPFWAENPPMSTAEVTQLAAKAVQSLGLTAIDIGMAPTPTSIDPQSIGIVGLPNWMWVKRPSPQTIGPAVGTASLGAVTVTVTAQVDRITWTMGDGSAPIVCTSAGTPYAASHGASPSPNCGHNPGYQKQGTYQVTAQSHWRITYTSNAGVRGSLAMELTRAASLTVGELQAVGART